MKRFIKFCDQHYLEGELQNLYQIATPIQYPKFKGCCCRASKKHKLWSPGLPCICKPWARYQQLLEDLKIEKIQIRCYSGFTLNVYHATHSIEQLAKRLGIKLNPRLEHIS